MRIIIKNNYDSVSYWTASYIKNKIMQHIDSHIVLGLPTGSTPLSVYRYLIDFYNKNELTFNMLLPSIWMNTSVLINLIHNLIIILCLKFFQSWHHTLQYSYSKRYLENLQQECINFEHNIQQHGGIDLMLGGIGTDGHIAFNNRFFSGFRYKSKH